MQKLVAYIFLTAISVFTVGIFTSFKPANKYQTATYNSKDSLILRSEKTLFHVSRSVNNNLIVYELNIGKDGNLNKTEPVHAYWIRNTEDGSTAELSYLQQKFAYGLHQNSLDKEFQHYRLTFVSYGKKDLFLSKSPHDKKYHVYIHVGKRRVILYSVFVKLEGGTFWFPNVPYIEIQGKDEATGELIKERFKP